MAPMQPSENKHFTRPSSGDGGGGDGDGGDGGGGDGGDGGGDGGGGDCATEATLWSVYTPSCLVEVRSVRYAADSLAFGT